MPEEKQNPRIIWDHGTAWDLFASLYVIFTPSDYGLRASWAAGVRSRLSSGARETLGTMMRLHMLPLPWLHGLDEPKTARVALDVLEAMPAEEILPAIALNPRAPESHDDLLRAMVKKGRWTAAERSQVVESCRICNEKAGGLSAKDVDAWIGAWEHAREFGSSLRIGIREFYEVFFRDEERRIAADLEHALVNARTLAERLAPRELFEELSQGIRNDALLAKESLVLVPCYWCSPRIIYGDLAPDTNIVLFGARPADASLIPGDTVPARLLLAMEALSDPTRLSILKAIIAEPLTQADIARRLRLRAPTISHHLQALRIAGLVVRTDTERGPTSYGARIQQIEQTCEALKDFLNIRIPESARAPGTPPTS